MSAATATNEADTGSVEAIVADETLPHPEDERKNRVEKLDDDEPTKSVVPKIEAANQEISTKEDNEDGDLGEIDRRLGKVGVGEFGLPILEAVGAGGKREKRSSRNQKDRCEGALS